MDNTVIRLNPIDPHHIPKLQTTPSLQAQTG